MMANIWNFGDEHTIDDVGLFSGITPHSMILGPISAFASIYLTFLLINKQSSGIKRICTFLFLVIVVTAMLMSASRSASFATAVGILLMILIKFRKKIKKLLKVIIILIIATISSSPLLAPQFEKIMYKNKGSIELTGNILNSRSIIWDQRISEFEKSPVFGIGFCSVEIIPVKNVAGENGRIEPGSSWLAILSMTGLVGMASILLILIPTLKRLFTYSNDTDFHPILLLGLLSAIIIHMFAEGYVFSGGSPLCFFFWLLLGISYQLTKEAAYSHKITKKKKNWPYVKNENNISFQE